MQHYLGSLIKQNDNELQRCHHSKNQTARATYKYDHLFGSRTLNLSLTCFRTISNLVFQSTDKSDTAHGQKPTKRFPSTRASPGLLITLSFTHRVWGDKISGGENFVKTLPRELHFSEGYPIVQDCVDSIVRKSMSLLREYD